MSRGSSPPLRAVIGLLALPILGCCPLCHASVTFDAPFVQTGGFYPGGTPDNDPTFQNYFVGYGTTPGFPRTEERRSFFIFDLTGVTEDITAAELALILPFGGLIADDPMETFVISGTPAPATDVMSGTLPPMAIEDIFMSFGDESALLADPIEFGPGDDDGGEKIISFTAVGIAYLNSMKGGLVVISGKMASFSFEPDPMIEGSELIFGFTDVVPASIDPPVLSLTVVPEPRGATLLALALIGCLLRRRR